MARARTSLPTPPLALTLGEPAGIGPDILLAAWQTRDDSRVPAFCVFADPDFLAARAAHLGLTIPIAEVALEDARVAFSDRLPVVPVDCRITARPGHPDVSSAPAAIASITEAVNAVQSGRASAVVTNPVAKSVLYQAGFRAPGHTEFLGGLAEQRSGVPVRPVMMLWSPELAVVPVTIHVPLIEVLRQLTTSLIVETGRIVAKDLRTRFGIVAPRLVTAGLNPHAGENGTIGTEDRDIVAPAVAQLQAEGINIRGPLPADTLFHGAARTSYDAALCMYHDQALIPIKTLAFDHAVNTTLGLPFIRTSPDHGTAFDIAGTGRASPASLVAALHLAARLAASEGRPAPSTAS